MSYDPIMEGMLAMGIALSTGNPSEAIETVENIAQNRARNNCMLPKEMHPNKEAFESLGFSFEEVGDDILYQATLPKGWSLDSNGEYWTTLIDEKGRKRGDYFYKGAFYDRKGHMTLSKRFCISYEHTVSKDLNSPIKVYVMDADATTIFVAGQCKKLYSKEYEELKSKAQDYLNTTYPEHEDPSKYWD